MTAVRVRVRIAAVVLACGTVCGESGEVTFQAGTTGCVVQWSFDGDAAVRHRSECAISPAGQAALIADLLRKTPQVRRLDWGRLLPDGRNDTTLSVRLAVAALRSRDWDAQRGVSRRGDTNAYVRRLANEAMIYPELQSVFRAAGLHIQLATVEKVLVLPAGKLPFSSQLRDAGARAGDKLPFDCQAWFNVTPLNRQRE